MCLYKRLGCNPENWVKGQQPGVSFTWVLHRLGDFTYLKIQVLVQLVMLKGFFPPASAWLRLAAISEADAFTARADAWRERPRGRRVAMQGF